MTNPTGGARHADGSGAEKASPCGDPLFEPTFSEYSYGYRPGRSARDAVEQLQREGNQRRPNCQVVDCDLKAFFDTVDHGKLTQRLRKRVDDPRLLRLIGRYLKAGVILLDGTFEETAQGVPQGGPLSPLMANVLLNELDHELEARGHSFARYADDFVILCRSPRAGRRILDRVRSFLQTRLKLIVNQAKSKVVKLSEATFLGFQIIRGRVRWTLKSQREFKESVKGLTGRTRGVSPGQVIQELTLYTRGALNYYMIGVNFAEVRDLDQWIRRRMRLYYWKQWKRPRTRRRKLLNLGIGRDEVKLASRSRKGPWRMSANSPDLRDAASPHGGLAPWPGSAIARSTMDRHSLPERSQTIATVTGDESESPDADPHVRWCGGRGFNPPAYPDRSHSSTAIQTRYLPS